ncbi:hypothetical protein DM860_018137 [Cuscuta australis]|uniref:Uncharacterized protein n=1 Tax=Cuscuta australis TaxID=267555 RepID=A0A328DGX0_9ASTE|nr:hypothetical protein DM860_018137 [Cuscuta australis]
MAVTEGLAVMGVPEERVGLAVVMGLVAVGGMPAMGSGVVQIEMSPPPLQDYPPVLQATYSH